MPKNSLRHFTRLTCESTKTTQEIYLAMVMRSVVLGLKLIDQVTALNPISC